MSQVFEEVDIDLNDLIVEDADVYHAKARQNLSSHQLIDFMNCPWLYRKKRLGLMQTRESDAYLVGRATHCRILEGRDVYESQFALGGPINPKTKKPFGKDTQAFRGWAKAQGLPGAGVHYDDMELIENMASGVSMNSEAVDLLLYGRAEGVVRQKCWETDCQIRIDWLHPHRGIVDLKTCKDLSTFQWDARKYRYINQLAFYQSVLCELIGDFVPVYIVAVEKKEPYRCGVWRVCEDSLADAADENKAAIERLKTCQKTDHWPTGYESIRTLTAA